MQKASLIYSGPADLVTLYREGGLSLPEGKPPTKQLSASLNSRESAIVTAVEGFDEAHYQFIVRLLLALPGMPIPSVSVENIDRFLAIQSKVYSILADGKVDEKDIPSIFGLLQEMAELL